MNRSAQTCLAAAGGCMLLGLCGGCLERSIRVTSEPAGAIVWLNDVEIGRTPVETDFTFYGLYDVRLAREGHEPVVTTRKAAAPIHEWPGLDLIAAALPVKFTNTVHWHFKLEPAAETVDLERARADLVERAEQARERYEANMPAAAGAPEDRAEDAEAAPADG